MSLPTPPQQDAEHGVSYTHPDPVSEPPSEEEMSEDEEEEVSEDEGLSEEIEIPSSDAADLDDDIIALPFKPTHRVSTVSTSNRMSVSNLVSGPEPNGATTPSRSMKHIRETIIIEDSSDDEGVEDYDINQDIDDMYEPPENNLESPEYRPASPAINYGMPAQVTDTPMEIPPYQNYASFPQSFDMPQPIFFTPHQNAPAELYLSTPSEVINTQTAALPQAQEHQVIDINETLNIQQTVEIKQPEAAPKQQKRRRDDAEELERPRKRIRGDLIVTGAACFVGGAVSLLATLSALPEGYFEKLFS
jgi:hypothetical protein